MAWSLGSRGLSFRPRTHGQRATTGRVRRSPQGYHFWRTILALKMHMIPTALVLGRVALAWRWGWVGRIVILGLVPVPCRDRWDGYSVARSLTMTADVNRHLLFGLIALQVGLIDQAQLVAAFQAWARDKARPLADHLADRGGPDADGRAAVEAMVALHIKKHGGDTEKSLASIPAGRSTRERLAAVGDPELTGNVARLASGSTEHDAELTTTYSVGSATIRRPAVPGPAAPCAGRPGCRLRGTGHRTAPRGGPQADPRPACRRPDQPRTLPAGGGSDRRAGAPRDRPGLRPGDLRRRPALLRHAVHPRRLAQGGHRPVPRGRGARRSDPGRRSLELRKLLRRFTDVCNAIDYAHSRGVLHRDIKPGNIIVGKHGETLVVDWGLAKPLGRVEPGSESGERTLVPSSASGSASTLPGSALGTPAYMSPEQAEGDLEHLGPHSDVYSLGATLYCLLTGKPPFEGDVADVIRGVQKGGFRPPRAVDPSIDPALEAVCLKAMALKPENRYASPKALAEDVERWMADEPVTAWREPWARRARRWARRNRTAVTAAGAAVLVALVGTAAVLAVQTRANADLKAANTELAASNQRERARFELAQEAIRMFHTGVSEDLLLKQKEFGALRTKLLRGAQEFYRKLEGLLGGQADRESRLALARAYYEVGELTSQLDSKKDSLAMHQRALALFEDLAREAPADAEPRGEVERSYAAIALLLSSLGQRADALAAIEPGPCNRPGSGRGRPRRYRAPKRAGEGRTSSWSVSL